MPARPRVLVFIVAYEAETTLERVIGRIPAQVFDAFDTEVLVIDDSSRDRTFEVGLQQSARSPHRITVLCNTANQGYGGNQKLGYLYAIRNGFDYVVLLHGDDQYPPEHIPQVLAPLVEGRADAVFGSRIMEKGAARKGGMPLYKYVGNRILTTAQNWLLGSKLSEFHSGFRAYRVATLADLPFPYNANVFHFDTEIIIQLLMGGRRIVEVPIPTKYGDEVCRVVGMRYAKDVMLATVGSRLHRLGIFYDRKFDVPGTGQWLEELKLGYASSHTMALDAVPPGARVLDVCGSPAFAAELARKGCRVSGLGRTLPAPGHPYESFTLWEEGKPPFQEDVSGYDVILLLDVIEHLKEPEAFLENLRARASSVARRPRIVVTAGNVVFWIVRLQALLGNFNYSKRGVLDLSHSRLYTFRSLKKLLAQCGFTVERVAGVPAPYPKALGMTALARGLVKANEWMIRAARGLFAYQLFMEATPLPTVEALLSDSIAGSEARAERVRSEAARQLTA